MGVDVGRCSFCVPSPGGALLEEMCCGGGPDVVLVAVLDEEGRLRRTVERRALICMICHIYCQKPCRERLIRLLTLIIPVVPLPTAIISPQYRSLHHERHHPPSASRLPNCCRWAPVFVLCCKPCCSACATSDAEAPSAVAKLWVGVARANVWERDR